MFFLVSSLRLSRGQTVLEGELTARLWMFFIFYYKLKLRAIPVQRLREIGEGGKGGGVRGLKRDCVAAPYIKTIDTLYTNKGEPYCRGDLLGRTEEVTLAVSVLWVCPECDAGTC